MRNVPRCECKSFDLTRKGESRAGDASKSFEQSFEPRGAPFVVPERTYNFEFPLHSNSHCVLSQLHFLYTDPGMRMQARVSCYVTLW